MAFSRPVLCFWRSSPLGSPSLCITLLLRKQSDNLPWHERMIINMDIMQRVKSNFPRIAIDRAVLSEWEINSKKAGNEIWDAHTAFNLFTWWDAPQSTLFADYAGIGFLPSNVFSYFLPGCVIKSLNAPRQLDAYDKILYRVAYPGYTFQNLGADQILTLGRYLLELLKHSDFKDTGSMNISLAKVTDRMQLLTKGTYER